MKEGSPVDVTPAKQLAYLEGVVKTQRENAAWAEIAEKRARQTLYNNQIETLSRVVADLSLVGLELPLVSENTDDQQLQLLLRQASEKTGFQGLFVDICAQSDRPQETRTANYLDLGVFLLPDGSLRELFYLQKEEEFTTANLVLEDARKKELPTLALVRLKNYVQRQAEEEKLSSLQQQLETHFGKSDPEGFITTQNGQEGWEEMRRRKTLAQLFPERGHRSYVALINTLGRKNIITADDLLSQSEEALPELRGIGPKNLEALLLLREFLNSSRVQV